MRPRFPLWLALLLSAVLGVGGRAWSVGPTTQTAQGERTWRAGGLDARVPGGEGPTHDVCAALGPLQGLDLYVAVSRGQARPGDLLVRLSCDDRRPIASRAALIALATTGEPRDVHLVLEIARGAEVTRATDAVEALLLAGQPVEAAVVTRVYGWNDEVGRRRLLVAMSAAGAADCLEAAAALEFDEGLADDARRRLEALR